MDLTMRGCSVLLEIMRKITKFYYNTTRHPDSREGENEIHIANHFSTTFASLCGHCDRTEWDMVYTDKKPTCESCLSVWNMVKGARL